MGERRTATYKIITDSGGNRYTFFCDLTGVLDYNGHSAR